MKKSTPLKFNRILIAFLFTGLLFSCDMEKGAAGGGSAEIGNIDLTFCDSNVENHHGCHCDFMEAGGNGTSIFKSNMHLSKKACLSINGTTEILSGTRTDERNDHLRHSHIPDWIVLDPDGDVHIFNELVDDANYDANKELLVETMLVMNEIPQNIMWRKNTDEDGSEVSAELSDKYEKMWAEAVDQATTERDNGNYGDPLEIALSNENYDVTVKGTVEKHNDDGSDYYTGTIEVKSKEGELLGSKSFNGTCICES